MSKVFNNWRYAALKNGFQDAAVYRMEFILEIIASAIIPGSIAATLWYSIFILGNQTEVSGFTFYQMLNYTFVSMLFSQVRGGNHDFELQEIIRTGQLSQYLLRPVSVVEFVYLRGASPRWFIALVGLLIGCSIGHLWGLEPHRVLAGMFLAFLGNIIHYQVGAILATVAFFWEESYAVLIVKNMLVSFLSGELIPLYFFPASVAYIWKSFPFFLYVYGPAQMALGRWTWTEYGESLLLAYVWMVGLWALIRWSWGKGLKKYSSLGG